MIIYTIIMLFEDSCGLHSKSVSAERMLFTYVTLMFYHDLNFNSLFLSNKYKIIYNITLL